MSCEHCCLAENKLKSDGQHSANTKDRGEEHQDLSVRDYVMLTSQLHMQVLDMLLACCFLLGLEYFALLQLLDYVSTLAVMFLFVVMLLLLQHASW